MKYKWAFLLAFVITTAGLGLYWYFDNRITFERQHTTMPPSPELYQYRSYAELIAIFGVAIFIVFIAMALKNQIGKKGRRRSR